MVNTEQIKKSDKHNDPNNPNIIHDKFWFDEPEILYKNERLLEFLPKKDMSDDEKLNSLTRMLLYIGIFLSLLYSNIIYMYIALFGFILTFLLKKLVDIEEKFTDNEVTFTKSTADNPFMNVLLTDYVDNPNRPSAGNIDDNKVKEEVRKNFNFGLYKDVDDVWDRNNSQRQYYSMPNTEIPNDVENTAHCKDGNLNSCLKYETPLAHGQII